MRRLFTEWLVEMCIEHGFNEEFRGFRYLLNGFVYSSNAWGEGMRSYNYIRVILGCPDGSITWYSSAFISAAWEQTKLSFSHHPIWWERGMLSGTPSAARLVKIIPHFQWIILNQNTQHDGCYINFSKKLNFFLTFFIHHFLIISRFSHIYRIFFEWKNEQQKFWLKLYWMLRIWLGCAWWAVEWGKRRGNKATSENIINHYPHANRIELKCGG